MHGFWEPVLLPLAEATGVRTVAEVGAEKGTLTHKLLDYVAVIDGCDYSCYSPYNARLPALDGNRLVGDTRVVNDEPRLARLSG